MESTKALLMVAFSIAAATAVVACLAIYFRNSQQKRHIQPTAQPGPQPAVSEDGEPIATGEAPAELEEEGHSRATEGPQLLGVCETEPTALGEAEFTGAQEAQPIAEEAPSATEQQTLETVPAEAEPTIIREVQTPPVEETRAIGTSETQAIVAKETEPTEQAQPQGAEKVQPKGAEEPEAAVKREQREPVKRGGRPRKSTPTGERSQTPDTKPRHTKPEIVCRKRGQQWVLAVEVPEEVLESPDLKILQNGSALDELEPGYWRLEHVSGEVIVRWNEVGALQEMKVELGQDGYLLFKLVGQDIDQGRLVRSPTSGSYLVIAPDTWERDETLSGPPPAMPEPVSLVGYKAHFFDLDESGGQKTAFRLPDGQPSVIEAKSPRFELIGRRLEDASEDLGPLFGDGPPRIRALDRETRKNVKTIVVGEEGSAHGKWRTAFSPDPGKSEQDLPSEVAARKGGWYFVRFYDANDELIESLDFRFIDSLKEIRFPQSAPLPSTGGHQSVIVEFLHTTGCTIQPTGNVTKIQIGRQEERTV